MLKISSIQNPRIRHLLSLSKPAVRKKEKLFVIEGGREIARASEKGISIESIFFCPAVMSSYESEFMENQTRTRDLLSVTPEVFSKIAYREDSGGMIAVAGQWNTGLENLDLSPDPMVIVLESVEKPGNLGAVLRTADAAAVDAVIICDPGTDIFNPNVVRSSVGCLFSNQIAVTDTNSAISYLKKREIKIFSAALQDAIPYTDADFRGKTALVFGSEADGLTPPWRNNATSIVSIPMLGIADSLNVSVSVAVITFEARRQRG